MQKQRKQIAHYWRDVFIAGAQVTFGVFAAVWFIPPLDPRKAFVLLTNVVGAGMFLFAGLKFTKRL